MTPDSSIVVRSSADLVALVPYVLGFHPAESMVVLGLTDGQVCFGARYDLPPPDAGDATHIAAITARQQIQSVALLAYGPPDSVTPATRQLIKALKSFRVRVDDAVRVTDGRWWSLSCTDLSGLPPDGNPCPADESVIAAQATYQGQVALPNRRALVAQVAAVDGDARAGMIAATGRAQAQLTELEVEDRRAHRGGVGVRRAGRLAVREAETRYRSGRALTDDEVAWLGLVLIDTAVNEYALDRSGSQEWQIQLWAEVLRRVEPAYVPAPACLLGFAAWRAGRGALARVAVDRAVIAEPGHQMAALLDEVLSLGIDPQLFDKFEAQSRQAMRAALSRMAKPSAVGTHWAVAPRTPPTAPTELAAVRPVPTKPRSGSPKAPSARAGSTQQGGRGQSAGQRPDRSRQIGNASQAAGARSGGGPAGEDYGSRMGLRSANPPREAWENGTQSARQPRAARRPTDRRLR